MTESSIGEALVELLEACGVDTIFGIPGVHNVEMYRALPRSSVRHILPRHEQGAGFMADGYARAMGKPGVCFTITGPGLTNILTPMAQAWSDSSPMLVISSALDVTDAAQGRGRLHEMIDQFGAAKSVTNLAMRAYTAKDVQDCVARAFSHFATSRPRPAYLEIPLDVLKQPAGGIWAPRPSASRPRATAADITRAVAKLGSAQNVAIIVGGGATGAGEAIRTIAEAIGATIFTTTAGKGVIPAAHAQSHGYRLASAETQDFLSKSGCILAVGTELSETDFWSTDFTISRNLIRIDIDPASLARPHAAEIAILADAVSTCEDIAAGLQSRAPPPPAFPLSTEASALRVKLTKVLEVIRDHLPAETIITSDMTQIAYAANEIFPVDNPRTWLHPVGFGTLGFALPAAIGAKVGVGGKPVAALAGDYGLQYTINELGTAVEHKLPIPILLWNNNALGQIRDDMVMKGIQPNAVTLRNPDFQMLAKAYGARAAKPASLRELGPAIQAALKGDTPTLIEMTPEMAL
jgi:5-guanidino-2-oxopentanoate decarboxylase